MGSAQLLANGNYFFENPVVFVLSLNNTVSYSMEIAPTPAAPQVGPADVLMDLQAATLSRLADAESLRPAYHVDLMCKRLVPLVRMEIL